MKWILVTGGAKNLGAAIVKSLAMHGYNVVLHYNKSEKQAQMLQKKMRENKAYVEIIQGDFSKKETFEKFYKDYSARFSDTFGIVHNVGNYYVSSIENTPEDVWKDLFQINVNVPFILTKRLFWSIAKNQGSIINIGFAGLFSKTSNQHSSVYVMTKSNLYLLTKMFAKSFLSSHVNVNMISPGYLEKSVETPKKIKRDVVWREICDLVLFLFRKENRSITGQNIEVAKGVGL